MLIAALQNSALYDHPVERFEVVETHISWVLLTGPFAYKIKKPVDLGFLDFSTLEKRRFFCGEELRLNRRLAPDLYLDVVAITGSAEAPRLGGEGPAIEYAVKMKQFPREGELDRVLARGELGTGHIDVLAREIAAFHGRVAVAGENAPFGSPERIAQPIRDNFKTIREQATAKSPLPPFAKGGEQGAFDKGRTESADAEPPPFEKGGIGGDFLNRITHLESWSEAAHAALTDVFRERKRDGFIRECHGDLHLANIAWVEGRAVIFDCIEFSEGLRWIDVMSEAAFLTMDLDDRGAPELSRRWLTDYLELTGDYVGLRVLRFYQVYRALVRAMVACIRMGQAGGAGDRARLEREYRGYVDLAGRYTRPARPALAIMHGLSGSGKTVLAQALVEAWGAVRVRSDVERKRLHGLAPDARTASGLDTGLYAPEAGERTYRRLADLARTAIEAGHSVIVDAACLKRAQRAVLREAAARAHAPFVILDVRAPEAVLRARIAARVREGRDASEADLAVLDHQIATAEPLGPDERPAVIAVDTDRPLDVKRLVEEIERRTGP